MPRTGDDTQDTHAGDGGLSRGSVVRQEYDRKIDYLIAKYELTGILELLHRKWTDDSDERWGIRPCCEYFNQQIVERVLYSYIGDTPVGYTPQEVVEVLKSDPDDEESDIDSSKVYKLNGWFRKHDVDPDELRGDLINFHTLYNYLREQGAESPDLTASTEEIIENEKSMLDRSMNRLKEDRLTGIEKLKRQGALADNEFKIIQTVEVKCPECKRIKRYDEFLEDGCECSSAQD